MNLSSIVKLHQTQNLIFGAYMCMGTYTHTHIHTLHFLNELYEKKCALHFAKRTRYFNFVLNFSGIKRNIPD